MKWLQGFNFDLLDRTVGASFFAAVCFGGLHSFFETPVTWTLWCASLATSMSSIICIVFFKTLVGHGRAADDQR